MSQTWNEQKPFYLLLLLILGIHCSLMVVSLRDKFTQTVQNPSSEIIKVKLIQEALKDIAAQPKRQIVQSEDSESTEKPKTPAYLSDKDRSFDRETMAKNVDIFKRAALGDASLTQKADQKKSAHKKKALQDLKLADVGFEAGDPMPKEVTRAPASESHKGIQNGDPFSHGLSATNDYVEEVTLGDFTHMNTVEYKFYGFYHRIRQKLEQFWGKSIQEKAENMFRAGRRLPASENLITSLQVKLNEKGEIVGVKILGASGVKELDDAAIESFNQAGPFPNPPKDLLVNGTATIEWGFVVNS
jgi:protein TonB